MLKMAFQMNQYDAEVIYNLAQLYLMQHKYNSAESMLRYYNKYHGKLQCYDREIAYYDEKIKLFGEFIETKKAVN